MSNIFCKIGDLPFVRITFPVLDIEKAQNFFLQLGWIDAHDNMVRLPGLKLRLELLKSNDQTKGLRLNFLSKEPEKASTEIIDWVKSQSWKYNADYTFSGVEIAIPEVFCSKIFIEKDIGQYDQY